MTKKLNGEAGKLKYEGIQPEFVNMSRRPGIGADWFANMLVMYIPMIELS